MDDAVGAKDHIVKALKTLDPTGTGWIDVKVLRQTMGALDTKWSKADFDTIVKAAGLEKNGQVSVQALVSWIFPDTEVPLLQRLHRVLVEVCMPLEFGSGRAQPQISTIEEETIVEYLTDVEGNWLYFMQFVWWSEILYWDESEDHGSWGPGILKLKDNGVLVFGGDSVDKGPGDIRVVKHLLYLKWAYWDRVFIVLGNRDLNKLRFYAELAPGETGDLFDKHGGAYWISNPAHNKKYETYLAEKSLPKGHMSTLKWMFDCNMGCQQTTFKMRRRELATIGCRATDDDTLQSFRDSIDPESADHWMLTLLRVGQLAVVVADVLFVHAGLHDRSVGFVPGEAEQRSNVQDWVQALNAWKDAQLKDYDERPLWREEPGGPGGSTRRRGGDQLIDYGAPGGCGGISVVYHNPFVKGNPHRFSEAVEDYLNASGIRRVFSGHQPHGESPTVVRHPRTGLLAVTCDTSYSNMGAVKVVNESNMRGDAISVARIYKNTLELRGALADGTKHRCTLFAGKENENETLKDALVGRQLRDGSWVKTILEDSGEILTAMGVGFKVSVQQMNIFRARMLLKAEYAERRFSVQMCDITGDMLRTQSLSNQLAPPAEPTVEHLTTGDHDMAGFAIDAGRFHKMETVIVDCYGTIWHALDRTLDRSVTSEFRIASKLNELISQDSKRVIFATNDNNLSRVEVLQKMREEYMINVGNVPFDEDLSTKRQKELAGRYIITSGFTCAWFLKKSGVRRPFVICSKRGFLDELDEMGIEDYVATIDKKTGEPKAEFMQAMSQSKVQELVSALGDIDTIVVGWDEYLTVLKIAVAAAYLKWSREIHEGEVSKPPVRLVLCSKDVHTVIGVTPCDFDIESWQARQILGLGNGSMGQSICACAGIDPGWAIDTGRPSYIFSETLRRSEEELGYNVNLSKAVIIGDSLTSDVELANKSGMSSVLVLSGATSRKDLEREEDPLRWPTWVVKSIVHIPSALT